MELWFCPAHNMAETTNLNNLIFSYIAEYIAIDKSLETIKTLPNKLFLMCSNALGVLKVVTNLNHQIKNNYIYSIRRKILRHPQGNKKLIFLWIFPHKELEGNEMVDQLSKQKSPHTPNHI